MTLRLPEPLHQTLVRFADAERCRDVFARLRSPARCMTPAALSAVKPSRVSFSRVLARRMIDERWQLTRQSFECDAIGDCRARYTITIGRHALTYIVRSFGWDGREKIGRRADGVTRDMFSALFLGAPDEARIAREFRTFDTKDHADSATDDVFGVRDVDRLRTDAGLIGFVPANRSVRSFDHVVDALTAGRQPDLDVIAKETGYLMRNAGFLGSGRNGTLSFEGYPADHPLRHPYFPDLFGLYLIRQVSIDLSNGIAAARSGSAATLRPEIARYIGVGNSSGQGMCVALQRWPHWVSTWITVRELAIAYAQATPLDDGERVDGLQARLDRARDYYANVQLQSEAHVVPAKVIAGNLATIATWIDELRRARSTRAPCWGDVALRVEQTFDPETVEQFNSLLIDTFHEFADAAAAYLPIGATRRRDVVPGMRVDALRRLLRKNYDWALAYDTTRPGARSHFWYHSADSGEQRRGDRGIDPHEEFESFIDHIGAMQDLDRALAAHGDDAWVAEVIADRPELAFQIARAQYLADLPYAEIRGNLVDAEFVPAHLIRFYLAVLGMECSSALSIRYVRGVFFQGMPLPEDIARGADQDWAFARAPALTAAQ